MIIDMQEIGRSEILAGAVLGKEALGRMISKAVEPAEPELCLLDFSKVKVATASHLRESVFAFRDRVRRRRSNLYPVLVNMNELVRDEMVELVRLRGDVIAAGETNDGQKILNPELIGELEPKQQLTLHLVGQRGLADASALMREHGEGMKSPTAWNNRLAALVTRGILMEITSGRAKQYKPVLEGIA